VADQRERDDGKPGWYKQTEKEFGDIFGPDSDEQRAINDWAGLAEDEREFYIGKLLYLNLRAQFHQSRTLGAMLAELRAVAADDEPEPAPRRGGGGGRRREEQDDDQPPPVSGKPSGPVTDVGQLPADVQAAIRAHQRPVVVPDVNDGALTPDEVLPKRA
jgi:hypothetical protein